MNEKKIKILGAGISGLTAAINLAKEGYEVEIYERNKDSGIRFNGDMQGMENWSEKEDFLKSLKKMNIELNFNYTPFKKLRLSNGIEENNLKSNKPLFYLVKRGTVKGTLDRGLKNQAINLGVKIRYNETLEEKEVDIVAIGPILKLAPAIVKGITFKTDLKDMGLMMFNEDFAYKWYSYFFVVNNNACLSTVTITNSKKVNKCFENTKNFIVKKYGLKIKKPNFVGGTGSFVPSHRYEWRHRKNKTIYVGEAAGLQDFLWGFGMRFAIESGYLAAKSIINNQDYKKLANKKFKKRLKSSIVNRFIWEILSKKLYDFLINNPQVSFNFLYSFHNFNLIQKILYPFSLIYLRKRYPKLKF